MYVIVIEDRHTDTDVELFEDKKAAIARARKLANKWGWIESSNKFFLFLATNPYESDCIFIIERTCIEAKE